MIWPFRRRSAPQPGRAIQLRRGSRSDRERVPETVSDILADYDAAATTTDNTRHWSSADNLSADAANSKEVREALRNRARYEAQQNNSYAKGICLTIANDTIGTGPRLQVLTSNARNNARIEAAWSRWTRQIQLAKKLRTMRLAKCIDGEAFAQLVTNEALDGVQLDLFLIEADQISTPYSTGVQAVDGIEFDRFGNVLRYHRLREHPGDNLFTSLEKVDVPAADMLHAFRCDRPGQHRGVPEITPALPLFAQLRRFTLATLFAAETAANFAGVMFTDSPAIADPDDVDAMDAVELERNAMLTLPRGWKMGQMRAEHPQTTYEMFKNAILNEIARCLNMPFHIAAGNAAGYNFASSRMDLQTYGVSIGVERSEWEQSILDRILSAWFDEASQIAGMLPGNLGSMDELPHRWHWDGRPHVDPAKEAQAQVARLQAGTTSYAAEFAASGRDWESEMAAQADALGLTIEEYQAKLVASLFGGGGGMGVEDEQESQESEA